VASPTVKRLGGVIGDFATELSSNAITSSTVSTVGAGSSMKLALSTFRFNTGVFDHNLLNPLANLTIGQPRACSMDPTPRRYRDATSYRSLNFRYRDSLDSARWYDKAPATAGVATPICRVSPAMAFLPIRRRFGYHTSL
jgi:hypothetical protein